MFGPGDEFPYAPERKYTPCDASKEQLFALRDRLGFDKNVIVQATCHGTDNRALVDALLASNGRARGVATVDRDVTDSELQAMHDAGVRGTRFNFVKRLVDFTPRDVLDRDRAPHRAARLARGHLLRSRRPAGALGLLHHAADDRRRRSHGPARREQAGRRPRVRAVRAHDARAREHLVEGQLPGAADASPVRLRSTASSNAYRDVVPFAKRLVETFPDRVLWGTDWPHPNLKDHMPDDGLLVDYVPHIATTPELQRRLLVDNPTRLYWVVIVDCDL